MLEFPVVQFGVKIFWK